MLFSCEAQLSISMLVSKFGADSHVPLMMNYFMNCHHFIYHQICAMLWLMAINL